MCLILHSSQWNLVNKSFYLQQIELTDDTVGMNLILEADSLKRFLAAVVGLIV